MVFLDNGDIRKINAGKGVIAFSTLFFASGTCNDLAVKYNIDSVSLVMGRKTQAVSQICAGVCVFHINRLLCTGNDNRLW